MANQKSDTKAPQKSAQEATIDRSQAKIDNFKRLANKRVPRALGAIASVGQLANRNAYTFDETQKTKILNALKAAVNTVETGFNSTTAVKPTFEV